MAALDWWGAQRAYPKRTIPDAAYGIAMEQARSFRTRLGGAVEDGVAPWAAIGPTNVGGRTLCLAFRPGDPNVLYAGSASGGLWKSTTGGVGADAWDPVDTGFPVLGVATIAIDPGNPDVMYIGTGEGYSYQGSDGGEVNRLTRGSYGVGILKTQDGGVTWTHSLDWTYNQSRGVWTIQIDPTNTSRLYAATTEGVYKSVDAGGSWSLVNPVLMATDVRIHPATPSTVWAAHGNFGTTGHGIYRSSNSGQTWTKLAAGLPASWTGKVQLAISPIAPYAVYASVANSDVGFGLYRWAPATSSWSLQNATDYAQFQGWYSHYVVVSPFSTGTLFTGKVTWDAGVSGKLFAITINATGREPRTDGPRRRVRDPDQTGPH